MNRAAETAYENGVKLLSPPILIGGITTCFQDAVWQSPALNCYSYALDCPEAGWAIPGQLCSDEHAPPREEDYKRTRFKEFLQKDGLIEISEQEALDSDGGHIIACVIGYMAFHFFRKEPDTELWTHKQASAAATNLDRNGREIQTPRDALLENREYLVGYFKPRAEGILITHSKPGLVEPPVRRYAGWRSHILTKIEAYRPD